jgi:hypothetical protein
MSSTLIPLSWAVGIAVSALMVIALMILAIFEQGSVIQRQAHEIESLQNECEKLDERLEAAKRREAALRANQLELA